MPNVQSLDDLKAENAQAETDNTADLPPTDTEISGDEYVEVDEEESADIEAEATEPEAGEDAPESEEADAPTLEAWQVSDESDTSQETDKGFKPNSSFAKLRREKQRAKREAQETQAELQKLREQVAQGQGQAPQQQPTQQTQIDVSGFPKLSDFNYDEAAFQQAVAQWNANQINEVVAQQVTQTTQQQQQQAAQKAAQQQIESKVNNHYQAIEQLIEQKRITTEQAEKADDTVRAALDNVVQGQGDALVDTLIANLSDLGDGTEKVFYHLGVNANSLNQLCNLLLSDSSGSKAMAYLGQLQGKLTAAPLKQRSAAPNPSPKLSGDTNAGNKAGSLQRRYKAASKKNDAQAMIDIRREARSSGVDVSNW